MPKQRYPTTFAAPPTPFGSPASPFPGFGGFSTTVSPLSHIAEPPDLSEISDPTLVVLFKNLLKKDENTKARALEELLSKLKSSGNVEDAVANIWVRVYPRLSIDTSRRVRQLSSTVLGTIGALSGRRFAKHMPKIVGSWLAGLYDSDRMVSRATRNSLVEVFQTEEKLKSLWKVFSTTILEYCANIIENEKVYTLSDERTTSADDAEGKFARVMTTTIMEVAYLIGSSSEEELVKNDGTYARFLKNNELWKFACHSDPALRKAVYRLLVSTLDRHPAWISKNLKTVSSAFLVKSFGGPQTSSADLFLDAVVTLTQKLPDAWESANSQSKKPPLKHLAGFLEQGSQLSPPAFWEQAAKLFGTIPERTITSEWDQALRCTNSIQKAIKGGKEPSIHIQLAWACYFEACYRLLVLCSSKSGRVFTLKDTVLPVYLNFLEDKGSDLQTTFSDAVEICSQGLSRLDRIPKRAVDQFVEEVWGEVEKRITLILDAEVDDEKLKRFAETWIELATKTLQRVPEDSRVACLIQEANRRVVSEAIEAINISSGSRVGTAAVLENVLKPTAAATWADAAAKALVSDFLEEDVVSLIDTPSAVHILQALISYGGHASNRHSYQVLWNKAANKLLVSSHDASTKSKYIQIFMEASSQKLDHIVAPCPALDEYIIRKLNALLNGEGGEWGVIRAALGATGNVSDAGLVYKLIEMIANDLKSPRNLTVDSIVQRLDLLRHINPIKLKSFLDLETSKPAVESILRLSDSTDTQVAASADALLDTVRQSAVDNQSVMVKLAEVIRDSVRIQDMEDEDTLPIDFLAAKAKSLLESSVEPARSDLVATFAFSQDMWAAAATPLLETVSNVSLAVTNSLAGCIFLVDRFSDHQPTVPVDAHGHSQYLRMVTLVTHIFTAVEAARVIPRSQLITLLYHSIVVIELLKDNISIAYNTRVFEVIDVEAEQELTNIVDEIQHWISLAVKSDSDSTLAQELWVTVSENAKEKTVEAFYAARALVSLSSSLIDAVPSLQDSGVSWLENTDVWKESDTFCAAAILTSFGNVLKPARKERICNELISDITGIPADQAASVATQKLVFLNSILPNQDETPISILPMRLTRLVKHSLDWFSEDNEDADIGPGLVVEVGKMLCSVLPAIESMYGEHWRQALEFIKDCWMGCVGMQEQQIPMLLWSLKLFHIIRKLVDRGENDDIREEWGTSKDELEDLLVKLLLSARDPDTNNQPRNMCYVQIERQLKGVSQALIPDIREVYPTLRVQSRPIQHAAFDILHRAIPQLQEEVSINAVISAESASQVELPVELLSLIMEMPATTPADLESEDLVINFRGYLLSWILIFDHFNGASFKVRSIYAEALKDGEYLPPLLDKIFSFLFLQGTNRPFDATKCEVFTYNLSSSNSDSTADLLHLQAHLYYLALRYTPALAKSWFLSQTNRAISQAIESFTERHYSPLLIASELSTVNTNRTSDDLEDLTVRVLKAAREVSATYPVDDQTLEISVRLPSTFPLHQVEVTGIHRVGMDENHFRRLLLASQAVVNFQTGSIIDALSLFRKNVTLHFQGVNECAICYSILAVTPDRALPNRACATCKNKFHATCLLKWFKTSNSSSCPLCRTSFSFYS
ncbi:hypothetical protein EX30DRAFT_366230 [Ascodesmis nigricans]|uniref:E3 ubiquitin-protein ligase listerin n=1 Tax=Ascodesmis nigricans TaxID=341454 RepID=A0A4S2MR65_9PEZI|nr:hypothetical protein EX30DRAFT_366230 [Ascodesmis nigricans]